MSAPAPRPPRLARTLLGLVCANARRDDVEADLSELFAVRAAQEGLRAARRQYWRDVLSLWWHRSPQDPSPPERRRPFEVNSVWQDIVFALRLLRRQRTLSAITLGSVTLAVGLTTALFGVLDKVAWPENGIRDVEQVFTVGRSKDSSSYRWWRLAELDTLRQVRSISLVAVIEQAGSLADSRGAESAPTLPFAAVSGRYFEELGGRPVVGRMLQENDDQPGAAPVVVLSYGLWRLRFGGDSDIVGRTVWMQDRPLTVAGVIGRDFTGPHQGVPPAFWLPVSTYRDVARGDLVTQANRIRAQIRALAADPSPEARARRQGFDAELVRVGGPWEIGIALYGRVRQSASSSSAEDELTAAARAPHLARGDADAARRIDVDLESVESDQTRDSSSLSMLAVSILVLILMIACVNIANVLFAGAVHRRREIGTRLALGASRWRLVRQLFTESCVLGLIGGVAGLLVANWLTPALGRLLDLPVQIDLSLDGRTYLFAAGCTIVAAIGAGLVPSLYARRGELMGAVKATPSSGAARLPAPRLRGLLIGGQTTASVILLVLAALFTRALVHLTTVELGFDADRLLAVRVQLGRDYDDTRRLQFWETAIDRIRQIPGVEAAALSGYGPMEGASTAPAEIQAASAAATDPLGASLRRFHRNSTTADYFKTIGLPLLRGRTYTPEEVRTSAPVAVISQSLARAAWGDASPIGSTMERVWGKDDAEGARRMGFLSKPAGTRVIGVVGDTVTTFMRPQSAIVYMPLDSTIYGPLLVRASNPASASLPVQEILRSLDSEVAPRVSLGPENLRQQLRLPRALAALAILLGATALVLAVVGLFGVTAFVVDLRRHEVSVRMALGATSQGVVRMLMRDCLRPVAVGAIVGLVLAPAGARLLRAALFGISPYDPWAVAGTIGLLSVAAACAVFIPARRASLVDPVTVLKTE